MTQYFKQLSETEFQKLKDAIALITVLIAGADGEINQDEIDWATKVTKIRSYKMSDDLIDFYKEVGIDFSDKLAAYIQDFPSTPEDRTSLISERLSHLNPILAKLDVPVAAHLYNSYVSFAKHVAKSTGGFLGFFSIGPKEEALLGLDMITPIVFESDEEE